MYDVLCMSLHIFTYTEAIATKLGICVYNHICNNMVPANKDNFQK